MPKATVVLADGSNVTIDGSVDEVAAILQYMSARSGAPSPGKEEREARPRRGKAPKQAGKTSTARVKAKGPADYIRDLVADDFFKTKRELKEIQQKLEEGAHIYPVTSISPAMFRLVKAKELRRIKEDGAWKYVNV